MIVDASALIAVVLSEPASRSCIEALETAASISISAATLLEASIVVDGKRNEALALAFDALFLRYQVAIEPVTEVQARIARLAYRQYGKGMGHPAQLSFGDCFAYALARDRNEPLLFTGDDFARTDIRPAIARA